MSDASAFPRRDFCMIRHGETEHGARKVLAGMYTVLSPKGETQGEDLRKLHDAHFENPDALHYVSSDAPRAVQTCRLMTGDKPHICVPELTERVSGRAGGLMKQKFFDAIRYDENYTGKYAGRLQKMGIQLDHEHAPVAVQAVIDVLKDTLPDKTPIIVSHSGTMRHTAATLGFPGLKSKNAELYHFIPDAKAGWKVNLVTLGADGKSRETPYIPVVAARQLAARG